MGKKNREKTVLAAVFPDQFDASMARSVDINSTLSVADKAMKQVDKLLARSINGDQKTVEELLDLYFAAYDKLKSRSKE